jgi:threonine/homoserine/homoserine lactone efflux protein
MTPILSALLLALSLSLGAGPGLVLQIDAAVDRGFKAGALVVFGIYSADLLLLIITGFSLSNILMNRNWQLITGMLGGVVLCTMGVHMLLKKQRDRSSQHKTSIQQIHHYITFFIKGFLVNLTNPTIIFYWLTLVGVTMSTYGYMTEDFYGFFSALLSFSILIDLIKVFAISRYRHYLRLGVLLFLNRMLGGVLVMMGIFFCVRSISLFKDQLM